MDPQISDLLALQKVDSAIQAEEATIAKVPEDIAAVDARIQEYRDRLGERQNDLEVARKERRTLEGELQSVSDKYDKYQTQLMEVKTNEAYRAMLKEIDTTKAEIAKKEEAILEHMLSVDQFAAEIKKLEKEFEADRARLEKEKAAAEELGRQAESKLKVHREERKRLAGALDAGLLHQYEKVLAQRNGIAVAQIEEELCLGCRVKVRPQICQEVRVGEIRHCDSCGRFLYFLEEFDPRNQAAPAPGPSPDPSEPTAG